MSTGHQLKGRQSLRQAPSKLERLNTLDSWTAQPAAEQAQVIGAGQDDAAPKPVQTQEVPAQVVGAGQGDAQNAALVRPVPLTPLARTAQAQELAATKMISMKMPVDLYHDLKLVAGSIPGESMVSIICRAVRPEVDALMLHLGYKKES